MTGPVGVGFVGLGFFDADFEGVGEEVGGSLAASGLSPDVSRVLSFYDRAALAAEVDWWDAFNDTSGAYRQTLVYDGAEQTVRADDQVHFSSEGERRAAQWMVADLTRVWASQ